MTLSTLNPQDFELCQVTDEDLVQFTRYQNSQSWKGHLSAKDYVIRECVLGKSKIASSDDNRLFVFMLRNNKSPEDRLCSCELLVRRSWKFRWDETKKTVIKDLVLSGCVGGVYTYNGHRGKGLAKIMIDKLVELAKNKYVGSDGFTFLYSEVGEYYARNGFKSFGVPLINIPLEITSETFESEVKKGGENVHFMNYHDFKAPLQEYSTHFEASVMDKVSQDHKTRVSIEPTSDLVDWFHLRAKYFSYKYFYPTPEIDFLNSSYDDLVDHFNTIEPHHLGLKITDDSGNTIGFIVWTHDWAKVENTYNKTTTILKIFVKPKYDRSKISLRLIELLKAYLQDPATAVAENSKPAKIVLWECEVTDGVISTLVKDHGAKAGLENGSLSAISINNDNEQQKMLSSELIWEGNDKLPWF